MSKIYSWTVGWFVLTGILCLLAATIVLIIL
jgi:hypothetical protein